MSHFDQDHVADLPTPEGARFDVIFRTRRYQLCGIVTAATAAAIDMHETWVYPVTVPPNYGGKSKTLLQLLPYLYG